jgi:hypothetical protein
MMPTLGVSDHALLRFLERAGGLDVAGLRLALEDSLARAHGAARSVAACDYLIRADGLLYVVRGDTVTTVLEDGEEHNRAAHLRRGLG